MYRKDITKLTNWKNSPWRKPLILNGVRQVGKTWLLKEFARLEYANTAYINFDLSPEFKEYFETTKDPHRILENLAPCFREKINPQTTLIIFDEVQECPKALASLKYFCENAPEYHIAAAGSLLGVSLCGPESFPVGKVDFLDIHPMTFTEFLLADGSENLADYIETISTPKPVPQGLFHQLTEKLRIYFLTGGMPEVVLRWVTTKDLNETEKVLTNICNAYERDFARHLSPKDFPKTSLIWDSIPSQLAKENKKFLFKVVREGARAREYEFALQWLVRAGLLVKVCKVSRPGLPLSAYDELSVFKMYFADVGILRKKSALNPTLLFGKNSLFSEFKGAFAENYIMEAIASKSETALRYWAIDNPPYEVDFLVQFQNTVIPIEVKADENVEGKSLKKYKEKYGDEVKLRVRFSLLNLKQDEDILNIPLFLADRFDALAANALMKIEEQKRAAN